MSLSYFSVSLLHFTPYHILNLQKENIQFFLGSQCLHEMKGGSFLETGIFGDHWPPPPTAPFLPSLENAVYRGNVRRSLVAQERGSGSRLCATVNWESAT